MDSDLDISAGEKVTGEVREIGFFDALWGFFSSMKTAIVLLLILAAASVAGTVIEQGQISEYYVQKYGLAKYSIIRALDLGGVYASHWYVLLLSLIGINLAVCSVNRFGIAWRRSVSPKVFATQAQVANMQRSESIAFAGGVSEAVDRVTGALQRGSYHVLREDSGRDVSLYAARGRLNIWGPYLTHLSILVIFAGAIFGGKLGFEGYTTITEGKHTQTYYPSKSEQKEDLGFRVALRKFTITYDKGHNATGYKSDLAVYDGGKLVAQKVIDVNHPLTYKGVSFFQSDYGLVGFVMKITAPNGEVARVPFSIETQSGQRGKQYILSGEPFKQVEVGGKRLTVFVHDFLPDYVGGEMLNASFMPLNPAAYAMISDRFPEYRGLDAWTRLGWIPVAKNVEYKGFKVALEDAVDYTGLQVSRNPGLPVIYAGFGLMLLGVFVSFYLTHRLVRVRLSPSEGGTTVTSGAMSRSEPSIFDKDFDRLREALV